MNASSKQVTAIALMTAFCIMGDSMMYIVLPIYWKAFGLTAIWQVGILLSMNRLVRLPLNPFVGWFYKKFDKRWALGFSVVLAAFTTFSYGYFHDFASLVITRALWGVSWSFLRLGGFLAILDIATDNTRAQLIGRYNGLWRLGSLVGMLAGGFFVDSFGITGITIVFSLMALCGLFFVWRAIPAGNHVTEQAADIHEHDAPVLFWKNPYILGVLATGLIMSMVYMGIVASTLSQLVEYAGQIKWHFLGITLAAATIAGIIQAMRWGFEPVLAPLFGKWSDRQISRIPLLIIGLFCSGVFFLIVSYSFYLPLWFFCILCVQAGAILVSNLTDALASDAASVSSKIGVMTAYTVIVDLGASLGPSIAFFIIEWINIKAAYQFTGGILLLTGLVWMIHRLLKKSRDKNLYST